MILDINSKEQTYYSEYESFCYQNCLRQVLEYFKVNNASFYINTSLSLILHKNDEGHFSIGDDNARNVLPEYQLKVRRYYPKDRTKNEVWEDNLKKLKQGMPIITGVDSYYLEYMPYFNESHGIHTVILSGYSPESKKVSIIDWFAPWFYKGNIDLESYIKARDSENIYDGGIFSGHPIMNNWAEVDNTGWNTDTIDLVRSNIDLSINQYYKKYKMGSNYSNGIYALNDLMVIVERIKELDLDDRKKTLKSLYYNLYGVVKRKVFFKHFLNLSYNFTGIFQFDQSKILMLEIISEWDKLLNIIMKGIFRCKDETLTRICEKIIKVIELEEDFYEHIFKLSKIIE